MNQPTTPNTENLTTDEPKGGLVNPPSHAEPAIDLDASLIGKLIFALQDARGFAELIEAMSKPDVEIYKHELRGDSERAIRRIDAALELIEVALSEQPCIAGSARAGRNAQPEQPEQPASPTVAGSVDTPEFREVLAAYKTGSVNDLQLICIIHDIIRAHINARLAPAAPSEIEAVELPPLPEPTIEGTVRHQELKICYRAPIHYTEEALTSYATEAVLKNRANRKGPQ